MPGVSIQFMHRAIFLILLIVPFTSAANFLSGNCDHLRDVEKYECEKPFEEGLIGKNPEYFERIGDQLILKSKVLGQSKTFTENPPLSFSEYGAHYRVIAFYPEQQISHIRVTGWEYFDSFVFHHTYGETVDVLWKVAVSPDGKLLLGFSGDLESGWRQNAVIIYSLGHTIRPLASYYPDEFGITNVRFFDEKVIEHTTVCRSEEYQSFSPDQGKAFLKYEDSVWQIGEISCNE